MEQKYIIAGLKVKMDTFGRTLTQAEKYLADFEGEGDITVKGDAQGYVDRWLARDPQSKATLDLGEYMTTGGDFYRKLLDFGGMMLHSSAVVVDGLAYLFSAPPGTGKSTHTSMWLEIFGHKAYILNDDKPALRSEGGLWYAYGTPWSGSPDISVNARVPLGGICVLTRGEENEIKPLSPEEAFPYLFDQTAWKNRKYRQRAIAMTARLAEEAPTWLLKCTISKEAALLSHKAMSDKAGGRLSPCCIKQNKSHNERS